MYYTDIRTDTSPTCTASIHALVKNGRSINSIHNLKTEKTAVLISRWNEVKERKMAINIKFSFLPPSDAAIRPIKPSLLKLRS